MSSRESFICIIISNLILFSLFLYLFLFLPFAFLTLISLSLSPSLWFVVPAGRNEHLAAQLDATHQQLSKQQTLVTLLEKDLANVNCRGEGEGEASVLPVEFVEPSLATHPLLPIISSQRERFRQRNQELEATNLQLQHQNHLTEAEVQRLRDDNIKLYEKIKFLQSYSGTQRRSDATESIYSSQYEQRLDPFASFGRQERYRRYLNLSPLERLTLRVGRAIAGSGSVRVAILLYSLLLHGLVFLVLYKLAQTESCKRDAASDCAAKFAEHMQLAHGGGGSS